MNKKMMSNIIGAMVFLIFWLGCAGTPKVPVNLGADYQGYLQQKIGNERIIDVVSVRGSASFVCRDGQHAITPQQVLGATYQVTDPSAPPKTGFAAFFSSSTEQRRSDKHDHEPVLDQLLNEAKRHYPSEIVTIRNARTSGHYPTKQRQEEYSESVKGSDGRYYSVTKTRSVWDCFPVYVADVITTEPMPQPVTHEEKFVKPGSTRNDIYRVARNWIDDNTQRRRLKIDSEDFDRGRIRGTVTCATRTDQTYIVTSVYTIDVYDERVEVRFTDTVLQRTDPSLQTAGKPEPIFLQSIADATSAELTDFSTTLRSYVLSR